MPQANFAYDFTFRITGDREVVAALDTMIMKGKEVAEGTRHSSQSMSAFGNELASVMRNLVTSQSDAARVSMTFLQTSTRVVSNLTAQSKAIMEQARRRGELYESELHELTSINEKIQQHTDLVESNSKSLNVNSREFEIHNRIVASNTSQMRQIDEFTGKYSSSVVQAKAAQQEFNSKLKDFRDRANVISNEMKILINDMDSNAVSTKVGTESWDMYQQQLERVINELREYIKTGKLSNDEMARATSQLASMTTALSNARRGFAGTGSTMRGMNKVTSGANQLMLSFGDIVQDSAQFSFGFAQGARAIGNNIAFAAEQFVIMRANMVSAKGATVTLGATMKALGSSLMGPIGVIVLINTFVTAITMAATRQDRLNKSVKEGRDLLEETYKSLIKFSVGDIEINLFEQAGVQDQVNSLISITNEIAGLQGEIDEIQAGIVGRGDRLTRATSSQRKAIFELNSEIGALSARRNDIIKQFPFLERFENSQLQRFAELEKETSDLAAAEEIRLEFFKNQIDGGEEYLRVFNEINQINQDLALSEAQRILGLEDLVLTQEEAVKRLQMLKTELIASGLPTFMLNSLLIQLSKTYESLAKSAKEYADSISMVSTAHGLLASDNEEVVKIGEKYAEQLFNQLNNEKLVLEQSVLSGQATQEQIERYVDLSMAVNELADSQATTAEKVKITSKSFSDAFSLISSNVTKFISSLTSLNQTNAAQSEAAAKKQFESQKKLSYASSVVAGAEAFVKALDEKPPFNFILAGLVAASTAAQLATISRQQFDYGGSGISGASGGPDQGSKFGFQMSQIEGPQTFRTPGYMPENGQQLIQPKVDVKVMANRKQLYAMVKTGEEEYRQIKV